MKWDSALSQGHDFAATLARAAGRYFALQDRTVIMTNTPRRPSPIKSTPGGSGVTNCDGEVMLSEGVANDWSALAMRDVLDAPAATAALAYGAFATAMTIGRLLTDRVAASFGPAAIVRFHWLGEAESIPDGKKSSTNLHILMNWQKQGADWKLLSRASTKL